MSITSRDVEGLFHFLFTQISISILLPSPLLRSIYDTTATAHKANNSVLNKLYFAILQRFIYSQYLKLPLNFFCCAVLAYPQVRADTTVHFYLQENILTINLCLHFQCFYCLKWLMHLLQTCGLVYFGYSGKLTGLMDNQSHTSIWVMM